MATVVNTFPDRRAGLIGRGLGGIVGNVLEARRKKKEEEARQKKMQEALSLLAANKSNNSIVSTPALQKNRVRTALSANTGVPMGPTPQAAQTLKNLPTTTTRVPTGKDVASALLAAGVDDEFSVKLAMSLDQAKRDEEKLRLQKASLANVLAQGGELNQVQLFDVISNADIPDDMKLSLVDKIPDMAKVDPEAEKLVQQDIWSPEGVKGSTLVPESFTQLTREAQDAQFKQRGFNVTTQPILKPTGEERVLNRTIKALGDDKDTERLVLGIKSGAINSRVDPQGNVVLTDMSTGVTKFIPSPIMDAVAIRQVQFRVAALDDAVRKLDDITDEDLETVGFEGWFDGQVLGTATGIPLAGPVLGGLLDFFGLEPSEIAKAQVDRAKFFDTLGSVAQAIAGEEGERGRLATQTEIELAEEILTITKLSATPAGSRMAVSRMQKVLKDLRVVLETQLSTRTRLRPVVIEVDVTNEEGVLRLNRRETE